MQTLILCETFVSLQIYDQSAESTWYISKMMYPSMESAETYIHVLYSTYHYCQHQHLQDSLPQVTYGALMDAVVDYYAPRNTAEAGTSQRLHSLRVGGSR